MTSRRGMVASTTTSSSESESESEGQVDIGRRQQRQPPLQLQPNETPAAFSADEYLPDGSSWRRLLERSSALARPFRGSNYVQLATVDRDGTPRCRTVVFRGFLPPHEDLRSAWDESRLACDGLPAVLKMTTDARSSKVEQVATHPQSAAELVWWFPNSSEQFRIAGEVAFVGGSEGGELNRGDSRALNLIPFLQQERERMWKSLSDAARESFATDAIPGHAYSPPSRGASSGTAASSDTPPDSFLLMLLVPRSVDYLRLANMYRQKDRIEDGAWTSERVNP